jgi:hypothetical protein
VRINTHWKTDQPPGFEVSEKGHVHPGWEAWKPVRQAQSEEELTAAWKLALQGAEEAIERGELHEYDSEFMEEVMKESDELARSGKPLNPDVLP